MKHMANENDYSVTLRQDEFMEVYTYLSYRSIVKDDLRATRLVEMLYDIPAGHPIERDTHIMPKDESEEL